MKEMTIKTFRKKSAPLSNLNTRYGVLLEERASKLTKGPGGFRLEGTLGRRP